MYPETTGQLHTGNHSNFCEHAQTLCEKLKVSETPAWKCEVSRKPHRSEKLLVFDSFWERKPVFFKGVIPGRLNMLHGRSYTKKYLGNINWTQWVKIKMRSQSWLGRKMRIDLGKGGGQYDGNILYDIFKE